MEDLTKAKPLTVRLYSGKYVQINDLKLSDICLKDIAHSLAFKPRFNGNGKSWYSIAAHSIAVSHLVPPHLKLSALLHDASEGYLFDIPAPNKNLEEFKDIVALEDKIQSLVYDKFFIREEERMCELIRTADYMELHREWNLCMLSDKLSSNPKEDEREFIRLYITYVNYMSNFQEDLSKRHSFCFNYTDSKGSEIINLIKKHNITDDEIHFSTN